MKMRVKLKAMALAAVLFCSGWGFSQFGLNGTDYGQTTNDIRGVGVGDFQGNGAAVTNSRFHINNFYCNQPTGGLNGLLFRSDGNSSVDNMWQLYTGANAGAITEKFRLSVPASSSNVNLSVVQNASMLFSTNNTEKMRLTETGFLGLGTNAPSSFFHLNTTATGNLFRTDGLSTNLNQWQLFTDNEKFSLSVPASSSNVNLSVVQNASMLFSTNNTEKIRLTETGFLGLGTNAPSSFFHLNTTTTGELFRTDGAAANTNRWRLFTTYTNSSKSLKNSFGLI